MNKLKAIIFDLGGVILNIDQEKTLRAFVKLGLDLEELNGRLPVFRQFETGQINEDDFRQVIRTNMRAEVTDEQIDKAWNAMLLDMPLSHIEILKQLEKHYRIFLLSNTNSIHMKAIYKLSDLEHGEGSFAALFEKMFFSYEIGLYKPEKGCYLHVLDEIGLKGNEVLFVDDSKMNVRGAAEAGMNALWAKEPIGKWLLNELKLGDTSKVN
jgi:HAD superfamily hydrolase (TIGR01509 family)